MIRKILDWPGESNLRFYGTMLALFLSGGLFVACGEADWMGMDCEEPQHTKTAIITYEWTTDPKVACKALGVETLNRGGACIQCVKGGDTMLCTLHAEQPSAVADRILGHEVKHAFGCTHRK